MFCFFMLSHPASRALFKIWIILMFKWVLDDLNNRMRCLRPLGYWVFGFLSDFLKL